MAMLLKVVASLALFVALAHAVKPGEEIVRTDKWCGEHHFGAGAAGCVKHSGCAYDDRAKKCHSSTFHSDEWCDESGSGSLADCLQFSGCVYIPEHDGKPAVCSSTVEHTSEWCFHHAKTTIEDPVQRCEDLSGCRYDDHTEACIAEEVTALDILTCTEIDAEEGLTIFANHDLIAHENPADCVECMKDDRVATTKDGTRWRSDGKQCCEHTEGVIVKFIPECTEEGDFKALQYDDNTEFFFCMDIEGHEIPDSRYKKTSDGLPPAGRPTCEKFRRMNEGLQCPNAMVLNVMGGGVVNQAKKKKKFKHPDVGSCDMTCNTDVDCGDGEWCCFNGCGQSCQKPIMPHADCNNLVIDPWLKSQPVGKHRPVDSKDGWTNLEEELVNSGDMEVTQRKLKEMANDNLWTPGAEYNKEHDHGSAFYIDCADHWWGSPQTKVHCVHGIWESFEMTCHKDCLPFKIEKAQMEWQNNLQTNRNLEDSYRERDRNYDVTGKGLHHGSKRKVKCIEGYGPIDGLPDVMMNGEEAIECVNGVWQSEIANINDPPLPIRTLVCDVCFDAPPHKWRDAAGRDCTFYKQRPMKCMEEDAQEALDNCRVACRTCDENRLKYIRRNVIASLEFAKHKDSWNRIRVKKLKMYKPTLTKFIRHRKTIRTKIDRATWKAKQEAKRLAAEGPEDPGMDRVEAELEAEGAAPSH